MKLKIDRKAFANTLAEIAPFANQKAVIPVLKNARITTKGNRMKIEANDTKSSMIKYMDLLECDSDATFLVEAYELSKFIAKTNSNTIGISLDGNTLCVSHDKGAAEFQTLPADDFVAFKIPEEAVTEIYVKPHLIADAISKGKGFVMTDNLKPQMCAIYAYIKDSEFGFCATDTRKMIHGHSLLDDADGLDIHWLIMPSVFSALERACKTADIVKIQISENTVSYRIGNVIIQSLQAIGRYPDFKRVIPDVLGMKCMVDKSEFAEALGRVSLFCDTTECVKMDVSRMNMTLSVDNITQMRKSTENIMHNGCDGEISIGINANHAQTCLGAFNSGNIVMEMDNESRPVLFTSNENENLQVIVMPMQLHS